MKRKMCLRKEYCPGKIPKCNRRFHCPKNTNDKCEIITNKPKVRRIKAMAAINSYGMAYAFLEAGKSDYWNKKVWKPCTILISEKYLKDRNETRP